MSQALAIVLLIVFLACLAIYKHLTDGKARDIESEHNREHFRGRIAPIVARAIKTEVTSRHRRIDRQRFFFAGTAASIFCFLIYSFYSEPEAPQHNNDATVVAR